MGKTWGENLGWDDGKSPLWRRWLPALFAVYGAGLICLITAVLWSFMPSPFAGWFSQEGSGFDPKAMADVFSLVGLTGVAFGWIVTSSGQRAFGALLSELIRWAYPGAFLYYFFLFLPLTAIGIYAGNTGRLAATAAAAIGILTGVALLIRICYVLVLNTEKRERVAFGYYQARLRHLFKYEAGMERRRSLERVMLKMAAFSQEDAVKERGLRAWAFATVWRQALTMFRERRGGSLEETPEEELTDYLRDRTGGALFCIELSKEMWRTMLTALPDDAEREALTLDILCQLKPEGAEREYAEALSGLFLALAEMPVWGEDGIYNAIRFLDQVLSLADMKFDLAYLEPTLRDDLALMAMVGWMIQDSCYGPDHARRSFKLIQVRYSEQAARFLRDTAAEAKLSLEVPGGGAAQAADRPDAHRPLLHWYLEWGIRKELGMTLCDYALALPPAYLKELPGEISGAEKLADYDRQYRRSVLALKLSQAGLKGET